jgi:carbonic anhydrase
MEHLMTYPIVREAVAAGSLQLTGLWFNIATAEMYAYERDRRGFVPIDRAEAERLQRRLGGAHDT